MYKVYKCVALTRFILLIHFYQITICIIDFHLKRICKTYYIDVTFIRIIFKYNLQFRIFEWYDKK